MFMYHQISINISNKNKKEFYIPLYATIIPGLSRSPGDRSPKGVGSKGREVQSEGQSEGQIIDL